ncbi:ORF6N domain-containing protein [Segetibacter sp.]|uniref:ORF6N domain-containing protein n=1 Tax=Segetibacter sp. TaxID=2231182 RepID=UPI002615947B|nr:ORF6N domain-containing protein [Segetibacter sp.]
MLQLRKEEYEFLRLQIEINEKSMSSQIVITYSNRRPNASLSYAFTEQGVAMLAAF